jgi:hypothetical protein
LSVSWSSSGPVLFPVQRHLRLPPVPVRLKKSFFSFYKYLKIIHQITGQIYSPEDEGLMKKRQKNAIVAFFLMSSVL